MAAPRVGIGAQPPAGVSGVGPGLAPSAALWFASRFPPGI